MKCFDNKATPLPLLFLKLYITYDFKSTLALINPNNKIKPKKIYIYFHNKEQVSMTTK